LFRFTPNKLTIAMFSVILLSACNKPDAGAPGAILIIHGGPILTMEGDKASYVEAVAVADGKIVFAGSDAEAMKLKTSNTVIKELGGNTMLPGFVDAHSHFINAPTLSQQANVSPSPVGAGDTVPQIIAILKAYQEKAKIPDGGWILGWGYDDSMVKGGTLKKRDLDAAFPNHKVLVMHVSLHGGVLNSKGLEWAGVSRETPTPPGGVIARGPDGKEPEGLLMETAFLPVFAKLPQPSEAETASHLSKLPLIATEALTENLIELSSGVTAKTGACARLTDGSTADAKRHRTANRMKFLSEHGDKARPPTLARLS
jgi:predicted amidohydrolase YtcJ